jgi:hypothetical protein
MQEQMSKHQIQFDHRKEVMRMHGLTGRIECRMNSTQRMDDLYHRHHYH